jgi:hypothetical protein
VDFTVSFSHPLSFSFTFTFTFRQRNQCKRERWDRILAQVTFSTKFRAPPLSASLSAGERGGYKLPFTLQLFTRALTSQHLTELVCCTQYSHYSLHPVPFRVQVYCAFELCSTRCFRPHFPVPPHEGTDYSKGSHRMVPGRERPACSGDSARRDMCLP